jgi:ASCH domain
MKALSLTQPWAWLVVHGGKVVENRTWTTKFRGRFLVHASKRMTEDDWMGAYYFAKDVGGLALANGIPGHDAIERGGIVGVAELVGVLEPTPAPTTPWHMAGQFGFLLTNVQPLPFRACAGALGFWNADRVELTGVSP